MITWTRYLAAGLLLLSACATRRAATEKAAECGPEGEGQLQLVAVHTGEPVGCALATVLKEVEEGTTEVVTRGHTNRQGRIVLPQPEILGEQTLVVIAEGYARSMRPPGMPAHGEPAQVEMLPADGLLLRFVDPEGRPVPSLEVKVRRGEEVLAERQTNRFGAVYFEQRAPFGAGPVSIEARGYAPQTLEEVPVGAGTITLR